MNPPAALYSLSMLRNEGGYRMWQGLEAIFGDVGMDEVDDVWPDGGLHDIRERDGFAAVYGHIQLRHLNCDERAS
ncbi:hypothetical protein PVL29_012978 [Vitis rotundifolia]|uniref:Uncharacterized protein n=1 Tax=Vitis rotundifolia TaxID=103349 RepID=A0AA39DNQ4_VITRO|nr:hypothetical protein PVL29_012978 [Vitis rotundifolia]